MKETRIANNYFKSENQKQRIETMSKEVPLKYKIEEGVENPKQILVKCKDADGNENKELIPVFGNGDPKELLIELYSGVRTLEERYSWTERENNPKAKLQFQHFARGLRGEHLRKWNKIIDRNRSYTSATFVAKTVHCTRGSRLNQR